MAKQDNFVNDVSRATKELKGRVDIAIKAEIQCSWIIVRVASHNSRKRRLVHGARRVARHMTKKLRGGYDECLQTRHLLYKLMIKPLKVAVDLIPRMNYESPKEVCLFVEVYINESAQALVQLFLMMISPLKCSIVVECQRLGVLLVLFLVEEA